MFTKARKCSGMSRRGWSCSSLTLGMEIQSLDYNGLNAVGLLADLTTLDCTLGLHITNVQSIAHRDYTLDVHIVITH